MLPSSVKEGMEVIIQKPAKYTSRYFGYNDYMDKELLKTHMVMSINPHPGNGELKIRLSGSNWSWHALDLMPAFESKDIKNDILTGLFDESQLVIGE